MGEDTAPAEGLREARVRMYGCLKPTGNAELVRAQLRAAHAYQNELVALERCRRECYRKLRTELCDLAPFEAPVERLTAELEALRASIRQERGRERRRVVAAAQTQRAKEVLVELRKASAHLKEARARAKDNPAFREAAYQLEQRTKAWHKGLRAMTPVYWGSYLMIERSMEQARRGKMDPTFKRWRGEGRIAVQLQGGLDVETLFSGTDTRARIVPAPRKWQGKATSARGLRSKVRHLLQIRVGSRGPLKREPVFAEFPLILHRPIPEGASIREIVVRVRKLGLVERWSASFTYTREAVPVPPKPGVVAIDLGWRKRPDQSLRVAYWVDDAGRSGEIRMPARVRQRLRYADSLREIQDRRFNKTMAGLMRWTRAAEKRFRLPTFLADAALYFVHWRSHEKLHGLIARWREARFDGDKQIFAALWRWREKSRHLYAWESHQRARALGYRREVYRIAAARFARHYGVAVLEDFDLTRAKRLNRPEEAERDAPRIQRQQLHACAPGEFRLAVVQAIEREGGVVAKLSGAGTTSSCHACGALCAWDECGDIWHTCEHCGAMWDQDANAARNLLARWKGAPITPRKVARAPKMRRRRAPADASTST